MKDSRELEKWPILQTIPTLTGPKKIVKKRITVCQMSIFSPKIEINEKLEKWLNLDFSAKNWLFQNSKKLPNIWILARELVKN